jgi:hypothetical protein
LKDAAPKDDTFLTAINSGILIEAITAGKKAKAYFKDYTFIGNINRAFRVCFARKAANSSL